MGLDIIVHNIVNFSRSFEEQVFVIHKSLLHIVSCNHKTLTIAIDSKDIQLT